MLTVRVRRESVKRYAMVQLKEKRDLEGKERDELLRIGINMG
jgi:hypothetical protein